MIDRTASDAAEFETVFAQTRSRLLAYLLRRAAGPEEAADLLSEAYLIAWRKLDQLPHEGQRLPWLIGVARNLLHRSFEHAQHREQATQALITELRALPTSSSTSSHQADPTLAEALLALSERDREILELTAWDHLAPREIALVLNISANTVRIRLHRTRKRLVHQLATETDPDQDPDRSSAASRQAQA